MNTMMALYFWLMQIFGVPVFNPALPQGVAPEDRKTEVAPPPPEDDATVVAQRQQRSFISNGF